MKTIKDLEDLKKISISLSKPILVRWPQYETEKTICSDSYIPFEHHYAVHNSVVLFVDDKVGYVIPYMLKVLQILEKNGFTPANMDVPFSKGDYPLFEKAQWFSLEHMAQEQSFIDFAMLCNKYCFEHGIKKLDDSLLRKCMEIPKEGIKVKVWFMEDVYFPILVSPYFNTYATHMLGLYSINNDVCIFVHVDGKTYVTQSNEVINALKQSGYIESSMFVPFARGEEILNSQYANLWKKLSFESNSLSK